MAYAYKFTNRLQKHFVVVQWDQRGTGKTANLNDSGELKVEQIHADVHEMITYLLKRFNRKKLFLVGLPV
jgi:predicted alpha/beta-fold hydrolase